MNIAVIGAGISGLVAAHRLDAQHNVTIFESNDYLGGHTNTIDVHIDDELHQIDTGFIVFNDWTYPNFIALLDELGVRSVPTSMSFSVHSSCKNIDRQEFTEKQLTQLNNGNFDRCKPFEYNGSSLNGLFSQRRNIFNLRFWKMLRDILRFNKIARRLATNSSTTLSPSNSNDTTIAEFLKQERFSKDFAQNYLLPMGSAIWSCPMGTFENFPLRFIVEFYNNHGLLNLMNRPTWRFVEGGSRSYVQAIAKRFGGEICLNSPVEYVNRTGKQVEIKVRNQDVRTFDHVILACHSNQSLRLLRDPSHLETQLLSAFPYSKNVAILHTDESILPRNRRSWASWNYAIKTDASASASVTYCMNILQKIRSKHVFCVTLNGEDQIDPSKIIGRYNYEHPVFATDRATTQSRHHELINVNRTSYAGAYWRNGFHEDGVVSALAVCKALDKAHATPRDIRLSNALAN